MDEGLVKELQELITYVESLPSLDWDEFDSIQRKAGAIGKKAFGDSNIYQKHFVEISQSVLSEGRVIGILKDMLYDLQLDNSVNKMDKKRDPEFTNKVFVVHGHDDEMKLEVARTLEKQDNIESIILHEQPNKGRTLIEKFEDNSDVSFAVVILSPDDLIYYPKKPEESRFRARQNVILELGYFIGKIGRERVFVLYKENEGFEIPSDYSGVVYEPYDNGGGWKFKLIKELQACGYDVDANNVL